MARPTQSTLATCRSGKSLLRTVLMAFVASAAFPAVGEVTTENLTHVRIGERDYLDKMDPAKEPTRWRRTQLTSRMVGGKRVESAVIADYVETGRDSNYVSLERPAPTGIDKLLIALNSKEVLPSISRGNTAEALPPYSIREAWGDCRSMRNLEFGRCTCELATLKPGQGAVGRGEVAKKTKDVKDDPAVATEALSKDPVVVVHGPDRALVVVDHHHGALAFLGAGRSYGTCEIRDAEIPPPLQPDTFWEQMKARQWVRLKDENGAPITPQALQSKPLATLPDDPYRTLVWMVRKHKNVNGFCRALMGEQPPPFAEFVWADWFRQQRSLPIAAVSKATDPKLWERKKGDREKAQAAVLNEAVRLAVSREAFDAKLPGHRNNNPAISDEQCNPSDGES